MSLPRIDPETGYTRHYAWPPTSPALPASKAHLVRSRRCYGAAVQTAEQRRALWEAQRALVAAPIFAGMWEPFGALGV